MERGWPNERSGPDAFAFALAERRALITFDLGFGDICAYQPGSDLAWAATDHREV